jgi:hypothetical protein
MRQLRLELVGTMTLKGELLKAKTRKELQLLAKAWTARVTEGNWFIEFGYSPERVTPTEEGYEIYMEAKR